MSTRTIRVPDHLWQAAMERATDRDETLSQIVRSALDSYASECSDCGSCEVCGGEAYEADPDPGGEPTVYAIVGTGRLHTDSNDPETVRLAERAAELFAEGAVAVSIGTDLDPDALPVDQVLEGGEVDISDAHTRIRHVAVEDTAAFADARMTLNADGTITGPVTFEGQSTGDIRALRVGELIWEDVLPVTLKMGHDGPVIGVIEALERVPWTPTTVPVAASALEPRFPDALFAEPAAGPMQIEQVGEYLRYSGTLAPSNVCHKGKAGCFTYRGADLGYFHSGALLTTESGAKVRVGPLVTGGLHADANNRDYATAEAMVADARTVFAMGRCFDTTQGLLFSGLILPDIDKAAQPRVLACAPSVELWPNARGRLELKTALMVPRPGFPVVASIGAGDGLRLTFDSAQSVDEPVDRLAGVEASLARVEKALGELYAAHLSATLAND